MPCPQHNPCCRPKTEGRVFLPTLVKGSCALWGISSVCESFDPPYEWETTSCATRATHSRPVRIGSEPGPAAFLRSSMLPARGCTNSQTRDESLHTGDPQAQEKPSCVIFVGVIVLNYAESQRKR